VTDAQQISILKTSEALAPALAADRDILCHADHLQMPAGAGSLDARRHLMDHRYCTL